jgi:hypothetical protein
MVARNNHGLQYWLLEFISQARSENLGTKAAPRPSTRHAQPRNRRRANADGKPQNHPVPLKKARPAQSHPTGPECVSPNIKLANKCVRPRERDHHVELRQQALGTAVSAPRQDYSSRGWHRRP